MHDIEINGNILGSDFKDFHNNNLIELEDEEKEKLNISYNYKYYLPPTSKVRYFFMKKRVYTLAISVDSVNKIDQAILYINEDNIDKYYIDLVKKYGKPSSYRLSNFYLRKSGLDMKQIKQNENKVIKSIPEPILENYKNMENVIWDEINSDKNIIKTSLIAQNLIDPEVKNIKIFKLALIFRKNKF
ncbi:hypothetical protein [Cellulophaga sp. Ld12]|uniref:hypothetical protein n=1 Tax=Cellulophaga sp. Ld12 TaxID=3229535 RepID=UPI00386FBB04